jgi:hypothetical protein
MGEAYGQLLFYMGLHYYLNIKFTRLTTHSCRHGPSSKKVGEKDNLIIFGVATDGFEYRFWRTDHQSNMSENLSFFLGMFLNSEGFQ